MSSTTKALKLLRYFSPTEPEIGLSRLCRIAKRDKATTYRQLQALESVGFVEQNPITRHYRLGPALLQLAQVREATMPRKQGTLDALATLAEATGETAHTTLLAGHTLYALTNCESPRHGIRAIVDIDTFPLHATASGICAVAFGVEDLFDVAVANFHKFTDTTLTNADELSALVERARSTGFGIANQSFETGIYGTSVPLFDQSGLFAGTVSVASVASRVTPELEQTIKTQLVAASREITRNWGGTVPAALEAVWARTLSHQHTLEEAS